ncbi:MAG: BrnT family toxin, partial [Desulfovibrionales bacterium]|nr:BrnT family toxin [Desulfovibrionales bacterium]
MKFEWDEAKSLACFEQRGFDFAYAAKAFFDPKRSIRPDDRRDYGEDRYRLFGDINGRIYVVVFTLRNGTIRIISAHKANQREVRSYDNSIYG